MSPINSPIPGDGEAWFQSSCRMGVHRWGGLLQMLSSVLAKVRGLATGGFVEQQVAQSFGAVSLEALPDYYLNCNSAKRLWQDWRVLRRLFIRRDHSRDLLLQGQSGWLPIHGMMVSRQLLTITTDEGETVLDLDQRVVWLSRANPANTRTEISTLPRRRSMGYLYNTVGCLA